MSTTGTAPIVNHSVLRSFAENNVNLPKSEVDRHRGQVQRLIDHLERVIDSHDHFKLITTLHSGSVRKGTALKSISDLDVAAYLDAKQVPVGDESKLIANPRRYSDRRTGVTRLLKTLRNKDTR